MSIISLVAFKSLVGADPRNTDAVRAQLAFFENGQVKTPSVQAGATAARDLLEGRLTVTGYDSAAAYLTDASDPVAAIRPFLESKGLSTWDASGSAPTPSASSGSRRRLAIGAGAAALAAGLFAALRPRRKRRR